MCRLRASFFLKETNFSHQVSEFFARQSYSLQGEVVKKTLGKIVVFVALLGTLLSASADENTVYYFDIPEQPLIKSLHRISNDAQALVLFPYHLVENRTGRAVKGRYTVRQALDKVLHRTGLYSATSDKGVLTIMQSESADNNDMGNETMNAKKKVLTAVVGFLVGGGVQGVLAQTGSDGSMEWLLEEIVVTASKRGKGVSVQDMPMAISALSGDSIEKRGLVGMDDFLRSLPGVSMQDRGAGQNSIVIRGLSADPQASEGTAGVYFGEVPLSGLSSAGTTGNAGNADIKLVDVERIEVLRGPQGTLYGADSMAGTVRVLPVAPNLQQIEGKLATRYSVTGEEGGDNTMLQAVLNVPLVEDTLAVRAVVYSFENSGYVNNVALSQPSASLAATQGFGGVARDRSDVGNDEYTGFRLTTLWKPTESLDVTLTHLQQDIEQDGVPEVELGLLGDYQQRRNNTGLGGRSYESLESEVDITSLVVNYDLGWGALNSSSSWINYKSAVEEDKTYFSDFLSQFFGPSFFGLPYHLDGKLEAENFVQELRLASNLDGNLQFVAGLYYEDKDSAVKGPFSWSGAADQNTGNQSEGAKLDLVNQKAVFGELSYAITDQLTATLGGRHFDYERTTTNQFVFGNGALPPGVPVAVNETGQTYKANLSYTPTEDVLVYAQWAEGFRIGRGLAPVNLPCDIQGIPTNDQLDSDTSENIELGFKASLVNNRLIVNAAVYSIDWNDIPIVTDRGNNCLVEENAGAAKSEGIELEIQAQLTESFYAGLSASYGEATLVGDSNIGRDGDNLPGSADFNASFSLQYDFSLSGYDGFGRIDYTYISEYFSSVDEDESALTPSPAGGFSQVNMKAGINFDQVAVDIFVNNLANDDGLTWVETGAVAGNGGSRAYRIRPRTIGLNLSYQF
ncbi:TonB-dependent receptor [Porticoccaceae bacterium]|nr:TonB-dependent receptor [Porticoccaceae bacterium]